MDAEGQEQPQLVAASDDDGSFLGDERYNTGSRDPFFQFKAEQDGIYRLKIHDLAATRESRPSHLYRLSIRQSDPDFHLLVATDDPGGSNDDGNIWEPLLRLGGKTRMNVMAIRRDGFAGKIDIEVKGLPSGISFPGATIPEKSNGTYLFFEASREAAGWTGAVQVIGRARIDGRVVKRQARYATLVWNSGSLRRAGAQSRVVRNRTLAVSRSELAPQLPEFRIEKQVWDVPLEGNLEIPFQLARRSLLPGDLRLRLGTFDGLREATTKLVVDDKSSEGTLIYKVTKRGKRVQTREVHLFRGGLEPDHLSQPTRSGGASPSGKGAAAESGRTENGHGRESHRESIVPIQGGTGRASQGGREGAQGGRETLAGGDCQSITAKNQDGSSFQSPGCDHPSGAHCPDRSGEGAALAGRGQSGIAAVDRPVVRLRRAG